MFLARCGDGFEVRHFHHAGCRQLARSMGARATLACFTATARVMAWPDRPFDAHIWQKDLSFKTVSDPCARQGEVGACVLTHSDAL